jgi:TIR domain
LFSPARSYESVFVSYSRKILSIQAKWLIIEQGLVAEGSIFISYRREDSIAYAGRLNDHLRARFGRDRVFMDVDAIEPGEDFVEVLKRKVGSCAVLIAVIGKGWYGATPGAQRRLDNPDDYVRLEIAAALERGVRVIPALVGGARMPGAAELPPDLVALTRRNAIEISDTSFQASIDKLIEALERLETGTPQIGRFRVPKTVSGRLVALALVAAAAWGLYYWVRDTTESRGGPRSTEPDQVTVAKPSPPTRAESAGTAPAPTSAPAQTRAPVPGAQVESGLPAPRQISPTCGSVVAWPPASHGFGFAWEPVREASNYTVEVDCFGCTTKTWFSQSGVPWHVREGLGFRSPIYNSQIHIEMAKSGGLAFRWRVWAVNAEGKPGAKSAWCQFAFAGTLPR